ncbi:MAG: helix-turn-helix domain-containing protein [Chloroflexota bacterium]|nr:helix-turn-helix domain-containing protein [Chloroflexota bacterium]
MVIPADGEIPLGTKIRVRRQLLGLSIAELGRLIGGYDRSHLSHVEVGRVQPNDALLKKIGQVLHIEPWELRQASREQVLGWREEAFAQVSDELGKQVAQALNTGSWERRQALRAQVLRWLEDQQGQPLGDNSKSKKDASLTIGQRIDAALQDVPLHPEQERAFIQALLFYVATLADLARRGRSASEVPTD